MARNREILILSQIKDVHATTVKLALERGGERPTMVFTGDYPSRLRRSLRLGGGGFALRGHDADVVWLRRPARPSLPDDMHPGDRQIAADECAMFNRDFYHQLAPGAFWVNPLDGARRANMKVTQLRCASELGLRIPETLASNDPQEIRAFLDEHRDAAIHKTFLPAVWEDGDDTTLCFTSKVSVGDLPDDDVLGLVPAIFQQQIPKAYELRLTLFGATCIAAKLRSTEHPDAQLDWRAGGNQVPVEPYDVPRELQQQCFGLLAKLGIVSGCMDLIVTPDGEVVFLEINQAGQWLWLEESCPELTLLDAFVDFLHEGPEFAYKPQGERLHYRDFRAAALAMIEREQDAHVQHRTWHVASDSAAAAAT